MPPRPELVSDEALAYAIGYLLNTGLTLGAEGLIGDFGDAFAYNGHHYKTHPSFGYEQVTEVYERSKRFRYSYMSDSSDFDLTCEALVSNHQQWHHLLSFDPVHRAETKKRMGVGSYCLAKQFLRSSGVNDRLKTWDLDTRLEGVVRVEDSHDSFDSVFVSADFAETLGYYYLPPQLDTRSDLCLVLHRVQNQLSFSARDEHSQIVKNFITNLSSGCSIDELQHAFHALSLYTSVMTVEDMDACLRLSRL
jgi:hypothetical protein